MCEECATCNTSAVCVWHGATLFWSITNILHVFVHSFSTIFLRGNSIFILPGHHYIGDDIANLRCARMGEGQTGVCASQFSNSKIVADCETAIFEQKRTSVAGTGDGG